MYSLFDVKSQIQLNIRIYGADSKEEMEQQLIYEKIHIIIEKKQERFLTIMAD